ncbi:MAG: hypothetical protein KC478_12345, partial [Bacteriovoracaceae bacterium]|nr:hypothetical protein [Bacteriovoracaceae bacterium]
MGSLVKITQAYNTVRDELFDIGLIKNNGRGLDKIALVETLLPNWIGGDGFFYHAGVPWHHEAVGFEEDTIYIAPRTSNPLLDVIRHEYGHALAKVKESEFEKAWFRRAFGGEYFDEKGPDRSWFRTYYGRDKQFMDCTLSDEYVTPYA